VDIEIQEQVFREQIELAADLQRSVVIHCVASHGKLLNILQDIALKRKEKELILPSSLILHSYSGSADMIKSFLALEKVAKVRVFFSYNGKQLSIPKTIESCKNTPLRSLLLETDAPDQAPLDCLEECNVIGLKVDGKLELNEPMLVQLALHRAAGIHSLVPKELGSIVQDNVNRAFPA
jgi:TatD DNase family protein